MSSLKDLERKIERIKRKIRELSEGDVEISRVIPILRVLGWNTTNPMVTRSKYTFKVRSRKEVDIALFSGDDPVVFFEVKKTSSALTDKDKMQLLEYCRLKGVQLGVLTNGYVWKFYGQANKASTKDAAEIIDIRSTTAAQAAKAIHPLLKRHAVVRGTVHVRLANKANERDKRKREEEILQGIWGKIPQNESLRKQLARFLKRMAGKEFRENISLDVAEKFIEKIFKSPASRAEQSQPTVSAKRKASRSRSRTGNRASVVLIFLGERFPVETGRDALVQALLKLYQSDSANLERLAEKMPNVITKSRAKPPSMRASKRIGESDFWVNCNWGIPRLESIFKRICKNLGLAEDAVRVQFENGEQH